MEKSTQRGYVHASLQKLPLQAPMGHFTLRRMPYWQRYGLAFLSVLIALALMLVLDPYLHLTQASFLLFFGAVTISALYGGRSSGVVATFLAAVFANFYFLEPRYTWALTVPSGLRMALFILQGMLISLLVGALRIAQEQTRRHFHQLQVTEGEVKALNLALQRRVDELQTLFDVIPINIAIAEDPDCRVIKVNPAFAELLQVSTDTNASLTALPDVPKPTYRFFSSGQELQGDQLPQQYTAKHGIELRDVEIDALRADGTLVHLYGHSVPFFDENGNARGSVAVYIDISERKQLLEREQAAREAAERANKIKDEFLAILSHELRTPLNPILGWAKLLQTRQLGEEKTRQALATIERNAKLQTQLIDDLLDVARILRGKLKLDKTPLNLVGVVESALEVVKATAEAKAITLTMDLPESMPVRGDEARLQQIVWNLLSNAIKFTPQGGQVTIRLAALGNHTAQISITDTGKGINPEFLPHLFQSFRQEDVSTTRQHGGLGLGLAIVKHLVQAHGGRVSADSPGEGYGATFTVQIPLLQETTLPGAIVPTSLKDIDLEGTKVLAVDDNRDARDLLTMLLTQYGAEVKVVASGDEVLLQLSSFMPDVLVCDIGMPSMDGYTLLRQIRQIPQERGGQIPAIAVTAFAREEDYQKALNHGFQRHIAKPIEPEQLAVAVAELSSVGQAR